MKQNGNSIKSRYNIEALARGLEILSLFSVEHPRLSLSQIVEKKHLNKSTAYRVLSTLENIKFIEYDPITRLYSPGINVLRLGFTAINNLDIRQIAHPYLENLAQEISETVSLAILDEFRTVYIDRVMNQSIVGLVLGVGSSLPAHCNALGKVMLADLPQTDLVALLSSQELQEFTPKTLTSFELLLENLEVIRQIGYSIDDEELAHGLRAAAAPIRDISKKTIAAINVTGTVTKITQYRLHTQIIPALLSTAKQISIALGYFPR